MARLIERPTEVQAAGNLPKVIQEFVGRVNLGISEVSIARMVSPQGWTEPGQTPEFDEYTVVLKGALRVKTISQEWTVKSGQGVHVGKGEWVQYSSPDAGGAEYIAVCLPAFSPKIVHRDPA